MVRGEDLLMSTARQLLIQRALYGTTGDILNTTIQINSKEILFNSTALPPQYFHLPLLRDEEGRRLAKRTMATSLRRLREEGLTPEAIRQRFFDKQIEHLWKSTSAEMENLS